MDHGDTHSTCVNLEAVQHRQGGVDLHRVAKLRAIGVQLQRSDCNIWRRPHGLAEQRLLGRAVWRGQRARRAVAVDRRGRQQRQGGGCIGAAQQQHPARLCTGIAIRSHVQCLSVTVWHRRCIGLLNVPCSARLVP